MVKKDKNWWKILAFLLIVVVILETIVFVVAIKIEPELKTNEKKCKEEVCVEDGYIYFFHEESNSCYCIRNNVIGKLKQFIS